MWFTSAASAGTPAQGFLSSSGESTKAEAGAPGPSPYTAKRASALLPNRAQLRGCQAGGLQQGVPVPKGRSEAGAEQEPRTAPAGRPPPLPGRSLTQRFSNI